MANPRIIGGFRIIGTLGRGGMGVVHRAMQLSMGREVALKVLDERIARDPRLSERFLREARIAARVNHPHVVTVYDGGRDGDLLYLAMELVPGGDADKARSDAGGRLPPRRAVEIVRDAARGLAALHAVGLLHRDIKPANLFIAADGSAKLADLGLSRPADGGDHLTSAAEIIGTPAYMSPEQARGDALDIRSDIYALGATLYALVTGQAPYTGSTAMAIAIKAASGPFPDARRIPGVPAAVAELIRSATAADPAERFADPQAFAAACDAVLAQSLRGGRGTGSGAAEPARPKRVVIMAAGAAALVVVIAVAAASAPGTKQATAVPPATVPASANSVSSTAITPAPAPPTPTPVPLARSSTAPSPEVMATTPAGASAPAVTTEIPAWSSAHGQDAYGSWADLTFGDAAERLRWIAPGTFTMGSPPDEAGRGPTETRHQVTLTRGFWMGDTECTEGFWKAVTGTASDHATGDPDVPVQYALRSDGDKLAALLATRFPGLHARLPTEAEWEYACRAGTTGVRPGNIDAIAWYDAKSDRPFPVHGKAPNPWGLYDLFGDGQWVSDWWGDYPPGPVTDPTGPATGDRGVARGGTWFDGADGLRSAARVAMPADGHWHFIGFRFVIDPLAGAGGPGSRPPAP